MSHLFLAPHNDDETLFGSFTLLRYRPHVVVCLRSFRMASPSYPGKMPVDFFTREFETEMAMKTFGCTWEQWTYSDVDPEWDELTAHLRVLDGQTLDPRWNRVFAPAFEIGGNEQHNVIANIANSVFGDRVTSYLTYTASGKSRHGTEVEFEPEWIPLKHHALACYKTQAMHPATRAHFLTDIREYIS